MTYQIEEIDDWPTGSTRILPFQVPNEDDANSDWKDITGADITWELKDRLDDSVVLDGSDSNVSIDITDGTNGEFEVVIEKEATDDIEGKYREVIIITDATGDREKWNGQVHIEDID